MAAAVDHYRGDFLTGLISESPTFDEWQLLKAEWLRREALLAFDTLVQHHEANQRWSTAYRFAWRSVEIDPLREVVAKGKSPAAQLLERYHGEWNGDVSRVYDEMSF